MKQDDAGIAVSACGSVSIPPCILETGIADKESGAGS